MRNDQGDEKGNADEFAAELAAAQTIGNDGRHAEEEKLYTALIGRFPDRFEPYFRRALVRRTIGKRSAALEDVVKAIALKPDEPACHFFLGLWHLEAGSLEKSADDLEQAAALDTALGSSYYESSARFLRALALTALARFDDASRECSRLSPNAAFAVNGRRWTLSQVQACIGRRQTPQL